LLRAAERRRAERRPSQRAPRLSVRALEPAASHSARRARSVRRSLLPSLMDSPAPSLRLRPQALAVQPDDPLRAWSEGRFPGRLGRGLKYLIGCAGSENGPSALNDTDENDDDCDDEQDVDEAAHRVRRHHAEKPQDEKNDEDGPEHVSSSLLVD